MSTRPRLTPREVQALRLWASEETKQRAAEVMGLAASTVDGYLDRVRRKYGATGRAVGTRAGLLARAVEDGVVDLADVR